METAILVTLGPSSLSENIVTKCANEGVSLFRINLSHTPVELVAPTINKIRQWTDVPICLDSEGAQLRNQKMINERVELKAGSYMKIHFSQVVGDSENISFSPDGIVKEFVEGDAVTVDFNSACMRVVEKKDGQLVARVERGGFVGSNKATDLDRLIPLEPITPKDIEAIGIGKKMGIKHFALSFTNSKEDVSKFRDLVGEESYIISKIESAQGILNLESIIDSVDQILIDRGDLSRQVPIEKIPFLQRRIISLSRAKGTPVNVATNLLESMITSCNPTRAEVNDVVSTLLMGANGLVLAAETAVGQFPVESVRMIRKLIDQVERWTPNTSINEIVQDCDLPLMTGEN